MAIDRGKKPLAIGTEDFAEVIQTGSYYVDKTGLITGLLSNPAKVTLFTRPRRFGKTLNMSMLKCFFEVGADPAIFEGLAISKEMDLCERYMGKYPVISLTLKDADGDNFSSSCRRIATRISVEAMRFDFLRTSPALSEEERELYVSLLKRDMDQETIGSSLWDLCRLLEKHYGQKAVLLIDEYDVPLQKAFYAGYYDEMVNLIRGMFSQALKTNPSLQFAVLTGCLRISKESIFTGMNNLKVFTVSDSAFAECFGFTDIEVHDMLDYYGLADSYGSAKEWYDGYRFGRAEMYCPWDVVNYCYDVQMNKKTTPKNYWANSSGNDAVREFVRRLDASSARRELESLVEGGMLRKEIYPELTYRDMYGTIENLWSLLYMTGYLTGGPDEMDESDMPLYELSIPNAEIRAIFTGQIMELFREETKKDGESLDRLCGALAVGDAVGVQEAFNVYLRRTISVRDTMAKKGRKENFYHGILLGILSYKSDWIVTSNRETGDGYGDILVETDDRSLGIAIEVKYARGARDEDLDEGVKLALKQIETHHYDEKLREDGVKKVLKYGIACYKKWCRVAVGD